MKYVLYYDNRSIVAPGDVVAKDTGNVIEIATPSYLIKLSDGRIIATIIGLLNVEKTDDRVRLSIIPLEGRYFPKEGDLVIGIVTDIGVTAWFLDIRAPFPGILNASDYLGRPFNPAVENLRKYLDIGDLVLAKIAQFDRTRDPILTVQDKGLGKIVDGVLVEIKPSRVPRVIGRKHSMINMLKEETGCDIVVANNGRILIRCPNTELEAIAILAIKKIEREAHTQGLTERIREFVVEQKVKRGLIGGQSQ